MRCIADYDLRSDVCLPQGTKSVKLIDPVAKTELIVGNLPTTDNPNEPRLSAQLFFEASNLDDAEEIADEHLFNMLGALAFATNSRIQYHRLLRVVDWTPGLVEREARIYAKYDLATETEPLLAQPLVDTAGILLAANPAPWLRRAFHWFRLALGEESPSDMFQLFWFALEIVAEARKGPQKVNDLCPKCRVPLFCEKCGDHPTHRPYAKQAIRQLIEEVAQAKHLQPFEGLHKDMVRLISDNGPAFVFDILNKMRNALMHGDRMKDVEKSLPIAGEHIVDLLGRVTWCVLLQTFPIDSVKHGPTLVHNETYVRRHLQGASQIFIKLPEESDGTFPRDKFPKMTISVRPAPNKGRPVPDEDTGGKFKW